MARALPPGQVHTFSLGFGVPTFDETDAARAVAGHLGLDHKDRIVAADAEHTWSALIAAADEPLADTSAIPTYRLAAFARQFVTVALSGDGADECFAGYETYAADRLHRALSWMPAPLARGLHAAADRLLPVSFSKVSLDYKLRHFLSELALPFPRAHASWRNIFSAAERREIMQPQWREMLESPEADPFRQFEPHYAAVADCHELDQASYVDIKTWLADDILVKVDRATMAHSLEARAPLLDHRLVEFAAALPPRWKLKGLRKKHLFKQSQRGRLPDWVLSGKKQGFNAPISQWLSGPLRGFANDVLASERLRDYVRPDSVARLWREQDAGQRDNGLKLFGLVCLSLWLNQL
jgi:asparagine synthase (glutamine-hydrolysing)